jgi:peptide-methionine (R)-S-oxide reductase
MATRTTSPIASAILLLIAVSIASTHGFTSEIHSVHRNRDVPSIRSSPFQGPILHPSTPSTGAVAAVHTAPTTTITTTTTLQASPDNNNNSVDPNRRRMWTKLALRVAQVGIAVPLVVSLTRPAWATKQSRTEGYSVQKSESEWKEQLSPLQYNVLREGGTERPGWSILETEKRPGTYECVACGTPLFESTTKFSSGTGWPSFADILQGVEVEQVDPITASIAGAESRCGTCGGHLGDLFRDGFLYQGTPAAETGKRYCIDGAALLFKPAGGGAAVPGDRPAKA